MRPQIDPLAQAMARIGSPMREALRRSGQIEVSPLDCPKCGATVAVWVPVDGCLYHWGDGKLGAPLSTDRTAEVTVHCEPCRTAWRTSGRGVGRALYNGRPALR
jgi:hypothetical protein